MNFKGRLNGGNMPVLSEHYFLTHRQPVWTMPFQNSYHTKNGNNTLIHDDKVYNQLLYIKGMHTYF